jgi:hypothetical protein
VATRFTLATGDCVLRRERPLLLPVFRPPLFRPPLLPALLRPVDFRLEERVLDLRDDDLRRLPLLRPDEDFLTPRREDFLAPPDDLRAPPARLVDRFRPPLRLPLLRPEDPDRDLFLLLLRLLDFLVAAIRKLRVGGFVAPIARFAHNTKGVAVWRCHAHMYTLEINSDCASRHVA